MKPASLHGLNGVRAIACLLIMLFHLTELFRANGLGIWFPFRQTPGIHLFLVISGFMLVYTMRSDDTPGRFIVRRLARIAPLYWLLTLCAIGLAMWHGWLFPGIDLSVDGIVSSFLFLPDANSAGYIQPDLFTGWTLNYIVLSYALFAAATWAPMRWRPFVASVLLLGFMLLANLIPDRAMRLFWSDPIQLEFIGGMAAAVLVRDARVAQWAQRHSIWPVLIVGTAGLLAAVTSDLTGIQRTLACGIPASMMVFALAVRDVYQTPFPDGPLPWLGRISYSIYLIHPIVIPLVGAVVLGKLGAPWLEILAATTACCTITIAAANFGYLLIERPISDWVNRHMGGRSRKEPVEI